VDTPLEQSSLEALLESANLLHSSLDVDELLKHLLRSVMGRLAVGRGLVAVEHGGTLRLAHVRGTRALVVGDVFEESRAREAGFGFFVPIGDGPRPLGMLALATPARHQLSEEERGFLNALSGIAASGLANARAHGQLADLNRRLDLRVQELNTLLEVSRAFAQASGPDEVAQLLGLTLAGQLTVGRHAVLAIRGSHPPVTYQKGMRLPWPSPWLGALESIAEATLVERLPETDLRASLEQARAVAILPLRASSATFGLVALGARSGARPFRESDLAFGAGLVAQAVVAFENAWHQREILAKKQLERELALAAAIQQGLFPAELPRLDYCDVAAVNRPAQQVGGDYYDALTVDRSRSESRCLFCVADVSGKGLAASLLMSNIQATLRALLGREASLAELARCTNELLYSSTPGNKYVTAILLDVDPSTGECRYVNGGHTEGLVVRASGEVERLPATGLALGLFPGVDYEELTLRLAPGDIVALYSDGVTEAQKATEEEFGVERLTAVLRETAEACASEVVQRVLDALDDFVGVTPQYDDITLLVLKRLRPGSAGQPR